MRPIPLFPLIVLVGLSFAGAINRVAAAEPLMSFGTYHALVIGNNDYVNLPKLQTAISDAEAVANLLETRYGFAVRLLRNASRNDILRALNKYRADLTEEDNLLVYYAGHGWLDRQSNTGFWQPVDAEAEDDLNWISNEALTRRLHAMTARHVMVIADSCYSGTLVRSAASALPTGRERRAWLRRISEKRSRTAIVSGGLEPVADSGQGGHSVFANALLSALQENQDILEGTSLFKKISRPVVVNADQTPQYSDIRRAGHEGGEFLFVPLAAKSKEPVSNVRGTEAALPALQQTMLPQRITGTWISGILINPFDKKDHYRLHFNFKQIGGKVLGSIKRAPAGDSPRKYGTTKRPIVSGTLDEGVVTFQESFQVLMGSKTEDHRRTYTGEVRGAEIDFFQQDTLGNAPIEFTVKRASK
ncbi:MAG: hypothetical protein GKS00_09225 [Alphaproteobacteria bacterium]|nr:hypothetical protein [Alphaproteobacteria bacterium]